MKFEKYDELKDPINLDIADIQFGLQNIEEVESLKELAQLRKKYHLQYKKKDKDMEKTKNEFAKKFAEYKELKQKKQELITDRD